ncbi:hypothetical protein [Sediminibacterium ginsengisoli]|nr:hypothetical protein [Sediminibacterium ginsengisoli]
MGLDVYDIERDARTFPNTSAVIAHPPCRAWGRLRHFAKPRPDEKDLAFHAIAVIRKCGGVLEHPEYSTLWAAAGLPRPGAGYDQYGGWSLSVDQSWWGHKARKRTWLYIVGVQAADVPPIPLSFDAVQYCIGGNHGSKFNKRLKDLPKADRERTPEPFAKWLYQLALICQNNKGGAK